MVCICLSLGFLHHAARIQLSTGTGCTGFHHLGFLQLFLYHHRGRTYLEGDGIGLSAPNDSGCGAGLSREISVGIPIDGHLHGLRDKSQPCSDDLLLSIHHPVHDHCLSRGSHSRETAGSFWKGYCRLCCCSPDRCQYQHQQFISYLGVWTGIDAWKKRIGKGSIG